MLQKKQREEKSLQADVHRFSLLLETSHFSMNRHEGEGGGDGAHHHPVHGVCSRGLGLALPLHLVSEHDHLGLVRDHAHRVDVWRAKKKG